MSKRAADIFSKKAPAPAVHVEQPVDDDLHNGSAPKGNWSRLAVQEMERKLDGKSEELQLLRENQLAGIIAGNIPVLIDAEQIRDDLGTDRVSNAPESEEDGNSLEDLTENIRKRGLRTPIRVRPADLSWRPDPNNPYDLSGQEFLLQSGRRRLAACRALDIQPIAFLSFPDVQKAEIEDLHERYFENVARRDLTTAEKLFSIGLIADRMPELRQSQIAEILHTSQPMVSRSISLYQNYEALSGMLDLGQASMSQIDVALRRLKTGDVTPEKSPEQNKSAQTALPFTKRTIGQINLRLARSAKGKTVLTLQAEELEHLDLDRLLEFLEKEPN